MDYICLILIVSSDGLFVFIISGLFSDTVSIDVFQTYNVERWGDW